MNKFLKYTLIFSLLFVSIFSLMVFINYIIIDFTDIDIPHNKSILLLGDSNAECGLDDKIYKSVFNFAAPAESYYYTYLKLSKILSSQQSLDTVLISFSSHNIFDNNWFLSQHHVKHNFCRYYPLMLFDDLIFILKSQTFNVVNSLYTIPLQFIKNIYRKIIGADPLLLGGFTPLELDRLDKALNDLYKGNKIKDLHLPRNAIPTNSEVLYLNKIISLCSKNNIDLIFINLPKHKALLDSRRYFYEDFKDLYYQEFSQVCYFDFSSINIDDCLFSDLVHLNKEGANHFSNFLLSNNWDIYKVDNLE